jgi:hypothetical protein
MSTYADGKIPLYFRDWPETDTESLGSRLEYYVMQACEQMGQIPDIIILDWIGGRIGNASDPDAKRMVYQQAADEFTRINRLLGSRGVCMSQARAIKGEGYDNKFVRVGNACDCKTIGQSMTFVAGISGMTQASSGEKSDGDLPTFLDDQFLFFEKARTSSGGLLKFKRRFTYCRFDFEGTSEFERV